MVDFPLGKSVNQMIPSVIPLGGLRLLFYFFLEINWEGIGVTSWITKASLPIQIDSASADGPWTIIMNSLHFATIESKCRKHSARFGVVHFCYNGKLICFLNNYF